MMQSFHARAGGTMLTALLLLAPTARAQDTAIVSEDPAFDALIAPGTQPELLYDGATWSEGPLPLPDGSVIWSDIENNRVLVWKEGENVRDWLRPAQFHNGHALDLEGRVLAASHGKRGVERLEEDGRWHMVVDLYGEDKLNSPNDLVVAADGTIWFTDPVFGVRAETEGYGGREVSGGQFVYRFDPETGENARLDTPSIGAPNGLAFAPGEDILYVADSARVLDESDESLNHHIFAYDVGDDGTLSNERILAEVFPGVPDGIKVDANGNVWSSSQSGLQIFNPQGRRLGRVDLPAATGNLAFGTDAAGNVVYITASNSLWRIQTLIGQAQADRDEVARP